jgi:hypothetical protein
VTDHQNQPAFATIAESINHAQGRVWPAVLQNSAFSSENAGLILFFGWFHLGQVPSSFAGSIVVWQSNPRAAGWGNQILHN